jgi:regulator of protease activity HflC (stomatin/prohibitin superfamily)
VLWTNQHLEGSEEYLVTAPTELDGSARPAGDEGAGDGDAESTAGAGELAAVRLAVNWRIGDLPTFVRSAYRPQRVLQTLALQSLSRYTATHSIDELLGGDGEDLGVAVAEDLQAGLDQVAGGLGIDIVDVSVLSVHPPQDNEVAARFLDRASALQERETAIEQARTEAATTLAAVAGSRTQANRIVELNRRLTRLQRLEGELPAGGDETSLDPSQQQLLDELREQYPEPPLEEGQAGAGGSGSSDDARRVQAAIDESTLRLESLINEAGGEAAQLIAQARADAARTQLVAQSQAGEFPVQLEAYRAAPRVFVSREFYNMLRETLPELRKVVLLTDPASQPRVLELDLQTLSSGLNYTPGGDDQ